MNGFKVVALILAAGEGRRLGGPKALALLRGETFFARVARLLLASGVEVRVAVTGAETGRVNAEILRFPGILAVHNPDWSLGMLGSILAGLDAAEHLDADAVLVHPVDHPLVRPETVRGVVTALASGAPIVVPSHAGRRGHPAGFARCVWPDLRSADPGRGARSVLATHASFIHYVEAGPDCLWGVNTREDLALLDGQLPSDEDTCPEARREK